MHISVQYPGEIAKNDDERERIHMSGPHMGTFFNSFIYQSHPEKQADGGYDFTEVYLEAMKQFLIDEPRVANGTSFGFKFCA